MKQIIEIIAQFIDKATAPIKRLTGATKQLTIQQKVLDKWSKRYNITSKALLKGLKEKNFILLKSGAIYSKIEGKIVKTRKAMAQAAMSAKRFKFEWLTIMFAGMALDRVFGSIIRKQFELYGVTEMTGAAWTEVMAPVMDLLTPGLYKLLEVFMDLPEPLKFVIGTVVIFGAILGKVAGTIGAFMLPYTLLATKGITIGSVFGTLGSKLAALGKLFPAVSSTALGGFMSIIAIIAGVILIVKGLYMVIKGKFEGIGLIIMGIGAILTLFIGWWAAIPIAIGAAVYFIIKHWDKVKAFFIGLWNKLKEIFGSIKQFMIEKFKSAADFIMSLPDKIYGAFKYLGKRIKDALLNLLPDWMVSILRTGFKIVGGLGRRILGSFQYGGIVPQTGPYLLHKGEMVIPSGSPTYAPSITVYATVSSEYDVRKLASQLNRYWVEDFERLTKSRGIM